MKKQISAVALAVVTSGLAPVAVATATAPSASAASRNCWTNATALPNKWVTSKNRCTWSSGSKNKAHYVEFAWQLAPYSNSRICVQVQVPKLTKAGKSIPRKDGKGNQFVWKGVGCGTGNTVKIRVPKNSIGQFSVRAKSQLGFLGAAYQHR